MTLPDDPRDSRLAQLALLAVGLALLVASWRMFLTPHAIATLYERDLPAYQGAVDAMAAGHNPYLPAQVKRAHGLPFIAPPFVWGLYWLAAHSPVRAMFGNLLMLADFVAGAAIPAILSRLLLGPGLPRMVLGAGAFFALFLGSGVFSVLVANNGTLLYALIALGLVPAVRDGRWLGFHAAVALATAFKPFYAAFWLVPLLEHFPPKWMPVRRRKCSNLTTLGALSDPGGSDSALADAQARSQWRTGALAVAAAAASYAVPLLLAPRLMSQWLQTLVTQVVGHERLGDNLLGAVTADPRHFPLPPFAAHLAFAAALLGGSLLLGRLERHQRIAGLLLAAVFLNPRAMRYDLSTAAIPLLALVAGAVAGERPGGLAQAAVAAALAAVTIAFSRDAPPDGYLYAALALAALLGAALASFARPRPAA